MERPNGTREYATDAHDNDVSQVSSDIIALTDALLAEKTTRLTFEDFKIDTSALETYEQLKTIKAGELVTAEDEQLAMHNDYYGQLDIKKQDGKLRSAWVRAWGWDDDKKRCEFDEINGKYVIYDYAGEIDKIRHLEVRFSYDIGEHRVIETIGIETSTYRDQRSFTFRRHIAVSAYFETGYEGHHMKSVRASRQDVYDFLELVARIIGDAPTTY